MRTRFLICLFLVAASSSAYAFFKFPLFGSPTETALIVVEGELRFKGLIGRVKRAPFKSVTIRRPKDRKSMTLSASKNMVVFSNLKPGHYILEAIGAKPYKMDMTVSPTPDQKEQYALDLKAGDIGYFGKLVVDAEVSLVSVKNTGSRFEFIRNKDVELKAMRTLRKRYKKSKWASRFDERITELSQ